MRDHESTVQDISSIVSSNWSKTRKEAEKQMLGVNDFTILSALPSFRLFHSFPIDIMYLLYQNVSKEMWQTWRGARKVWDPEDPYLLRRDQIIDIGNDMERISKTLTHTFGKLPRNIAKHSGLFNAEEW